MVATGCLAFSAHKTFKKSIAKASWKLHFMLIFNNLKTLYFLFLRNSHWNLLACLHVRTMHHSKNECQFSFSFFSLPFLFASFFIPCEKNSERARSTFSCAHGHNKKGSKNMGKPVELFFTVPKANFFTFFRTGLWEMAIEENGQISLLDFPNIEGRIKID